MATKTTEAEGQSIFSYEVADGVAVIAMDLPGESVNTMTPDVAKSFDELLKKAEGDSGVKAVVFTSRKKDNFVAGAKIDFVQELKTAAEGEALVKEAQESFGRVDSFPKPVVAAINGACLGGGLEWALACDWRVASDSPKTSIGLPEVQIGLIPAAGGCQRLPRLIGVQAALDLILAGKAVKPQKAKKLGIVDDVVPAPILLEVAKRRAVELAEGSLTPDRERGLGLRGVAQKKNVAELLKGFANKEKWAELALEENPLGRKILFDQAKKQLLKKTRGKYPAPERALDCIRVGLEDGMAAGLAEEVKAFGELVTSDTAHRLMEIFFATTQLKKETGVADAKVKPRPVKRIGILGGGLMGGGIAYVTAAHMGIPSRVKEKDDAGVGRALKHVGGIFDERVRRRALSLREAEARSGLVTATTDYSGFRNVDVVIEAVFEDLALKQGILREMEAVVREDCIFASNTSSLPITELAKASKRPETVIGMHYFSPVNKMPLLEVITHPGTADWVTATCVDLGKKQGKTVIVVNDGVGFYTSRILAPYMNEAAHLLAEGADIVELDRALVEFGFPVGPILLLDEVGIDVGAKVAKIMHEAYGERMQAPTALVKVLEDGRQGKKNKKGFYLYDGKKKKEVDPSVYALLPHGADRKKLDRQEMAERCALQMVNEAIRCLGDKILKCPRDGDIGAIFGIGFPPFRGGPFRYADGVGSERLFERMEHWHKKLGKRFEPAPLLVEQAKDGKKFY